MKYGVKRDYPKIEIFVFKGGKWQYTATTTWDRTQEEAVTHFIERNPQWDALSVRAFHKSADREPYTMPGPIALEQ